MAVTSTAYAVGSSSPVQLVSSGLKRVLIQNLGGFFIYVGPSGVTASDGIRVSPYDAAPFTLPITLATLETLYAIADPAAGAATTDVRVLTYLGI